LWHAPIDPGEREVIALALELDGEWVILDDLAARKLASDRGLLVVGTVGVLIRAKQRGLLPAIRPSLDALVDVGFFIGSRLYHRVLTDTGEAV
jgi:hypothetical protein